jgi:type II secretory pathway component PulC
MVEPQNGALTVRDTGGFGQMIGLQPGDRVEQANGIALTAPDDVVGAVLRPLAANQPVRLTGKRNGQPRELWIANASCSG